MLLLKGLGGLVVCMAKVKESGFRATNCKTNSATALVSVTFLEGRGLGRTKNILNNLNLLGRNFIYYIGSRRYLTLIIVYPYGRTDYCYFKSSCANYKTKAYKSLQCAQQGLIQSFYS